MLKNSEDLLDWENKIENDDGSLWGWQGFFPLTSSSRAQPLNANLPNFDDFRLPLGGSWGPLVCVPSPPPGHQPVSPTLSFKLAKTMLGRDLPLTGGGGTVETNRKKNFLWRYHIYLTNIIIVINLQRN